MLSPALCAPCADGVKTILTVQLAPGARVAEQALVPEAIAYSLAPMPVVEMPAKVRVRVALKFVIVTTLGELDVPTNWLANAKLPGSNLTAVAVPAMGTVCGLLEPAYVT